MAKYYIKSVGNYGFTGAYPISDALLDLKVMYLDDLYTELGESTGQGCDIYLSKFMVPYEKVIRETYPKARVQIADQFDDQTTLHDWFPGTVPLRKIFKD